MLKAIQTHRAIKIAQKKGKIAHFCLSPSFALTSTVQGFGRSKNEAKIINFWQKSTKNR